MRELHSICNAHFEALTRMRTPKLFLASFKCNQTKVCCRLVWLSVHIYDTKSRVCNQIPRYLVWLQPDY